MKYKYKALLKYYPKRHRATDKQEADRQIVYKCKNGNWDTKVISGFITEIKQLTSARRANYLIVPIPASTLAKTHKRFFSIIEEISEKCGIENGYNIIINSIETESGHLSEKKEDPTINYTINSDLIQGKSIILIDDVITRGVTFERTADILIRNGAISVMGLFVAETASFDDMIDYEAMFEAQQEAEFAEYEEFLDLVNDTPICKIRGESPGCRRCGEETRWIGASANEYKCLNCRETGVISDEEKLAWEKYDKNPGKFKTCYECGAPAEPIEMYGSREWCCIVCKVIL